MATAVASNGYRLAETVWGDSKDTEGEPYLGEGRMRCAFN